MGQIVVHGPRDVARFALTYDDGPGQGTRPLLDLLDGRSARATFFMVGSQVEADPDLAREVAGRGHEIGSHTQDHLNHFLVDDGDDRPQAAVEDMVRGAETIERVVGAAPVLYRAPYGSFIAATLAVAEQRGWTSVMWSAAGRDWDPAATAGSIERQVLEQLAPGAIVLLHDARHGHPMDPAPMLGATDRILDAASSHGLEPVTVGELLAGQSG